ncbi:hypothetical protein LXL04_014100 [Taraxacum kok-saghyz]
MTKGVDYNRILKVRPTYPTQIKSQFLILGFKGSISNSQFKGISQELRSDLKESTTPMSNLIVTCVSIGKSKSGDLKFEIDHMEQGTTIVLQVDQDVINECRINLKLRLPIRHLKIKVHDYCQSAMKFDKVKLLLVVIVILGMLVKLDKLWNASKIRRHRIVGCTVQVLRERGYPCSPKMMLGNQNYDSNLGYGFEKESLT